MYDAHSIANWFLERSQQDGQSLTIMALLHLVYIAHGWHLAKRNKPLFPNRVSAWVYGPVIMEVYDSFRSQGITPSKPVPHRGPAVADTDEAVVDILQQIYDEYGHLDSEELSDLTNAPGGPWDIALQCGGAYAAIPDDLLKTHYLNKLHEQRLQNA